MANKKISELQSRTPALSDLMLVGDPSSGYSYKCTVTALATIIETDIADGYVTIGTTQTISGAKTFSNNLTLTSVVNTPTDPDKFLTLNASNVVTYRTGSQVLSDIGAADDSLVVHLAGTETITGFKTFQSRLSIDGSLNLLQGAGINTDAGYSNINASSTGFFLTRAIGVHAFFNLANLTTGRSFTFPDVTGTIALTSDITSALTGYVPTSRTLTINGVTQSLAANRTFNVGTVETVNFATGTTGTDVNVSGSPITTTGTITLNIPTASATNRGALSSTDWSTFNNKQSAISLTTTGNSGAATFVSNTLNIPNYTLSGLGGISGSGTTNYIPKFTSSSAIGNSIIYETGGLIGIGTTTPAEFVHLKTGSYGTPLYVEYTGGTSTYIGLANSGGRGYLVSNNNDLVFATSSSATERMRLTSGGLLGIGTSTPSGSGWDESSTVLHIYKNAINGGLLKLESSNTTAILNAGNDQLAIFTTTNDPIRFGTNGSERMRLDASGNLGLGTSAPTEKLDVSGTARFTGNVTSNVQFISNNGTVETRLSYSSTPAGVVGTISNHALEFYTNSSAKMTLTTSGNLGLGVSPQNSAGTWRNFQFGGGNIVFRNGLVNGAFFGTGYIFKTDNSEVYSTNSAVSRIYFDDNNIRFQQAPSGTAGNAISFTQAMTLDASGRLGIGTTSPGDKLQVDGNVYATAFHAVGSIARFVSGGGTFIAGLNGSSYGSIQSYSDASGTGRALAINPSGGNVGIGTTSPAIPLAIGAGGTGFFGNSSTLNAYANSVLVASFLSTGNVGIGTTSPNHLLQVTSSANFGAVLKVSDVTSQSTGAIALGDGSSSNVSIGIWRAAANSYSSTGNTLNVQGGDGIQFMTGAGVFGSASERMRITSGGNVGISTTNPTQLLDIGSNNSTPKSVALRYSSLPNYWASTFDGTDGINTLSININNTSNGSSSWSATDNGSYATSAIQLRTNPVGGYLTFLTSTSSVAPTERMRITSGGLVGIGATNPAEILELSTTTDPKIRFVDVGNLDAKIGIVGSTALGFEVNGSERMRITSGGELLINTTSDAGDYKLQVNGNGWLTGGLKVGNASGASGNLTVRGTGTTSATYSFEAADANGVSIFVVRDDKLTQVYDGNFEVRTGSIKTAAPSGGTAKPWKLGEAGVTLGGSNTSGVRVEIDGVVYYLVTGYLP